MLRSPIAVRTTLALGSAPRREFHEHLQSAAVTAPVLWVVTECYPRPTAPNSCAFVHRQLVAVRDAGWAVRVFLPNGWYPPMAWRLAPAWREAHARAIPGDWVHDGIPACDLRVQNRVPSRLSSPRSHADRVERALGEAIDRAAIRPSIVLVEFALPYGGAVRRAASARGIPYAVHVRGDDVWIWPHRDAAHMTEFREVIRHASLVIGVSSAIVREAERLAERTLRASVVIRNGIDLTLFAVRSLDERARLRKEFGIDDGDVAVLCVASELEMKGWKDVLDAIGGMPPGGPRVRLYGAISGVRRDIDIEREARLRAPNVDCRLFRELPHPRLADLYAAADVFALASHSEGLSNAVLEAMGSGLCTVVTDVGGHSEVIDNGVNGFLVAPHDTAAFRSALEQARLSGELRQRIGAAARMRMEQVDDAKQAGHELAANLRAAIASRSLPQRTV